MGATVDVSLRFRLSAAEAAKSGIREVAKAAQAAQKGAAKKSNESTESTTRSVENGTSRAIRAYRKQARSRETLGVRSEREIQREIRRSEVAYQRLARSGVASANELSRAQAAHLNRVRELNREMGKQEMGKQTRGDRAKQAAQVGATVAAGTYAAARVVANPIRAYADLEAAQADLKIALMTKGGKVSTAYDQIMKQAVQLGNKLPGATKDFVAAAIALKEQGMSEADIAGGGLKAASYFGVLAKMDQYQSATTVAKIREAYGLRGNELPEMANLMQQARNAFGIQPDDFRAVAAYAAPIYNTLGLTGLENSKAALAVQGMAAGKGLENSSFGTNFAMMLSRTAMIDSRVAGKGKEAEEVRDILKAFGVKMSFFTPDGKFAGVENLFAQLEKLKPLSDQDRARVLTKLFGVEAARPASIMADEGVAGYRASLAKLDAQADMEERARMKTSTLEANMEALGGTWENTMASMAASLGNTVKRISVIGNELLSAAQPVVEDHPALGTAAITGAGLAAGASTWWAGSAALSALFGKSGGTRVAGGLLPRAAAIGGGVLSSPLVVGAAAGTAGYYAGHNEVVGSWILRLMSTFGSDDARMALETLNEPEPAKLNADITIGLAPGLVLQQQTLNASGGGQLVLNTGNIFNGVPQ